MLAIACRRISSGGRLTTSPMEVTERIPLMIQSPEHNLLQLRKLHQPTTAQGLVGRIYMGMVKQFFRGLILSRVIGYGMESSVWDRMMSPMVSGLRLQIVINPIDLSECRGSGTRGSR